MANRIVLKRSGVANTAPSSNDLDYGELAINYSDGVLFYKNSGNVVQSIGSLGPQGPQGPSGPITPYIFDGGSPSSTYFVGPAFDCGGVT